MAKNDSSQDVIIGIDAGTSVIKAVAFDLSGNQLETAAIPNRYATSADGAVTQSMPQTWADCAKALRDLADKVPNLAKRTAAIAVTAQGDGTWLIDKSNQPLVDAWLWLDSRAAPTVEKLAASAGNRARFEATGTGLNTCQQGSQLAHIASTAPELLRNADAVLHCKDWIYLNLTGVRATDPSEASFTFGNFRTRKYDDTVIEALGLQKHKQLLPPIVDGSETTHALSVSAAAATGLLAGTPVTLGYVDMVMTALGAGIYTGEEGVACSVIGSTGVHMRAMTSDKIVLNAEGTGYVILLPARNMATQVQSNMAATLNLDWALRLGQQVLRDFGMESSHEDFVKHIDGWLLQTTPGSLLYHPYISEAGERGPFVDAAARASFTGLSDHHGYADLIRAVIEGLGFAMRDCYSLMGEMPKELRLTGGAARSKALRHIIAAGIDTPLRVSNREEAGAAGAAMMAAVAIKVFPRMEDCIATWVTPLLGVVEAPDPVLAARAAKLFKVYKHTRQQLAPVWRDFAAFRSSASM